MNFLVIIYFVGGLQISCTFNQDYFIYEASPRKINGAIPDNLDFSFLIKKKVIDFKTMKQYWNHYGDSTIQVANLEINKLGGWEAVGVREIVSVEDFPASAETQRLGIDCIKRVTKIKSNLFVEEELYYDRIKLIGSLKEVFEYLPDSSFVKLVAPIYVEDKKFCFENYSSSPAGQKVILTKIIEVKKISIDDKDFESMIDIIKE